MSHLFPLLCVQISDIPEKCARAFQRLRGRTCIGLRLDVLICPAFWRHLRVIGDKKLPLWCDSCRRRDRWRWQAFGGEKNKKKTKAACDVYVQVRTSPAEEWMVSRGRKRNSFLGISISKGKKRTSVWWLRRDGVCEWGRGGVEGCKDCMECFWVNCTWTPEKSISTWQNPFVAELPRRGWRQRAGSAFFFYIALFPAWKETKKCLSKWGTSFHF